MPAGYARYAHALMMFQSDGNRQGSILGHRLEQEFNVKNPLKESVLSIAVSVRKNVRDNASAAANDDLLALQRIAIKVRFARNRTIFNDGDEANFTYRVVSGVVRLCKHTVQGRRLVTHFLLPGDYFGFMQLGAYSYTAEAVGDVVAVCYPQRLVESLSEE